MTGDAGRPTDAQAAFGAPDEPRSRPSALGYWVGGALCAAAVAGAILWFVLGIVGFGDDVSGLQRVPVPGRALLELGSGRQAIYYESGGGENARVPPLRIVLRPVAGGAPVTIGGYSGSVKYSISGHAGRSLAGFGISKPGRYRLTVVAPSGAAPDAHLAVGRGLGGRLVRAFVGAIVIFLAGMALGGAMIGVTAARRS